jgi:hypothetical protein
MKLIVEAYIWIPDTFATKPNIYLFFAVTIAVAI